MSLWEQIIHRCGGGQFERQGYADYILNIKAFCYMVSEDFFQLSIIHVAILIPGVWPVLTPGA